MKIEDKKVLEREEFKNRYLTIYKEVNELTDRLYGDYKFFIKTQIKNIHNSLACDDELIFREDKVKEAITTAIIRRYNDDNIPTLGLKDVLGEISEEFIACVKEA